MDGSSVTRRLIDELTRRRRAPRAQPEPPAELTARETDVLRLVACGLSNTEIAAQLVLAEQTMKTYVGRVLAKLGLRDRTRIGSVVLVAITAVLLIVASAKRRLDRRWWSVLGPVLVAGAIVGDA